MKLIIVFFLFFLSLQADRGLQLKKMQEEQRVALDIGNNTYQNLSNLKNPINDARAVRDALNHRGFSVIYKENATKREMKRLVKKFAHKLSRGGVGMYYFAGHGVSTNGKNYLVGTDSLMEAEDEVEYETLALNLVISKMKSAHNRLNIIVLDACRNNPFGRSGGGGLAPVGNAKGMFVAYATEAGAIASDGKNGKHGLFTKHLINYMNEPGVDLAKVFKNTRRSVYNESNGKQSPGVYDQTLGDFFFTLPNQIKSKNKIIKTPKKESTYSFETTQSQTYSLTINTIPSHAYITILDYHYDYYSGIKLKPGSYNIKISKDGYKAKTGIIDLQSDTNIQISLEKVYKPKIKRVKKEYNSSAISTGACQGCHGRDFSKHALGKSKVVSKMSITSIFKALKGYKDGIYGGPMKGLMKGQVAKYSDSELEAMAQAIKQ